MRTKRFSLRAVLSALLAVVFVIAAEPGAMAMPPMVSQKMMVMDGKAMDCCDHDKPHSQKNSDSQKDSGTPCKSMAACAGMLSCFGIAAIIDEHSSQVRTSVLYGAIGFPQAVTQGLTLQPDNPPPIA